MRRSQGGLLAAAALIGTFIAGCGIAGCGSSGEQPGGANAPVGGADFKVGLLTPGDVNDQGWNQLAFEGLQAIEKETGAKTSHQVTKNAADQQPALRDYADQKYNLVICHGYEYGKRVKEIAAKYPDTKFAVMGGDVTQDPNVATIVPKLEEATYLVGMAAAGMSKTGVVGLIGGMKLPVIASTFDAFEQGAKAVNPKIKILTNYVGDFEDQNKAKEVAKAMIAQKADVLFQNADQAGKGMFVAAQEAQGVLVFGSNRNQNDIAPDICLGSAVIEVPHAFVELAKDVKDGKFKAEFRELNLKNDNIEVEWNEKLEAKMPKALRDQIDAAEKKIESGELKIKRNV